MTNGGEMQSNEVKGEEKITNNIKNDAVFLRKNCYNLLCIMRI